MWLLLVSRHDITWPTLTGPTNGLCAATLASSWMITVAICDIAVSDWEPNPVPARYREAMLRQLCSRYYSLASTTLGYLAPAKMPRDQFSRDLSALTPGMPESDRRALAEAVATCWIAHVLQDDLAFDATSQDNAARDVVAGYPVTNWGSDGKLLEAPRRILTEQLKLTTPQLDQLDQALRQRFCSPQQQNEYRIDPNKIRMVVSLVLRWWQCQDCTFLSPVALLGRCTNCGSTDLVQLDPTSDYLRSRKGFWRDALQACLDGRAIRPTSVPRSTPPNFLIATKELSTPPPSVTNFASKT